MLGHICFVETKGHRPTAAREMVLGLPLLCVSVPVRSGTGERGLRARMQSAGRLFEAYGVRRVLAAEDFPCWDLLAARGLRPVDPVPLCQAVAAKLALGLLAAKHVPPERATIALQGNRVTRPFFGAALDLAPRVRALTISAPVGGSELAAHLNAACGLPVLEENPGLPPDAVLQFSPLPHGEADTLVLCGPGPQLAGLHLRPSWRTLPEHFAELPLLAALWEEGGLPSGELVIY